MKFIRDIIEQKKGAVPPSMPRRPEPSSAYLLDRNAALNVVEPDEAEFDDLADYEDSAPDAEASRPQNGASAIDRLGALMGEMNGDSHGEAEEDGWSSSELGDEWSVADEDADEADFDADDTADWDYPEDDASFDDVHEDEAIAEEAPVEAMTEPAPAPKQEFESVDALTRRIARASGASDVMDDDEAARRARERRVEERRMRAAAQLREEREQEAAEAEAAQIDEPEETPAPSLRLRREPEAAPAPAPAPAAQAAPEPEDAGWPAPAAPTAARPEPRTEPEPAEAPEVDLSAIELPTPAAGRGRGRAGRAKTRLLGFNTGMDTDEDPFGKEANTEAAAYTQFPVGWLVITDGPGRGAAFPLFNGVSQIGRGEGQTIRLDFGDNTISRENHAAVAYDPEQNSFFIGHGGKANLVRCNNMPVLSTQTLSPGDKLRIGETSLMFVPLCGPDFQWTDS